MYRDLYLMPEHRNVLIAHDLWYDITVMPPLKMGCEYVKTLGHYHPHVVADARYTYPELYEVLEGEAHYLLQRPRREHIERVDDVVVLQARQGDKVLVPPNYGHVTINPSEKTLKMANLVCRSFTSIYEPYKLLHGAVYYESVDGTFLQNRLYAQTPDIKLRRPVEVPELGLTKERAIYDLIEYPCQLEFLVAPQKYATFFNGCSIKCNQ
jgi:glucose-6-phosphate isomerase